MQAAGWDGISRRVDVESQQETKKKRGRPPGSKNRTKTGNDSEPVLCGSHEASAAGMGRIPGQSAAENTEVAGNPVASCVCTETAASGAATMRRGPGRPKLPGRIMPGLPLVAEVRMLQQVGSGRLLTV